MTDAELAFKTGALFDQKVTSKFWESFKGECGRVQAEVLVYMADREYVKAYEMAYDLDISKQHVSKILRDYDRKGFIDIIIDDKDKRTRLLSLNAKGREYLSRHIKLSNMCFENLLSQMDPEEKKRFIDAMRTMSDLLSEYDDQDQ